MPPKKVPKFFNNRAQDIKYLETENNEFKDIFEKVCSYIGKTTTTDNFNLQQVGMQLIGPKKFKGVYPYDVLPTLKPKQSAIINTDTHLEPGTHWVAIYRSTKDQYYLFDSYGREWKNVIPNLKRIVGENCDIISARHIRQFGYTSSHCGQSSLSYLIYLYAQPKPGMALVI